MRILAFDPRFCFYHDGNRGFFLIASGKKINQGDVMIHPGLDDAWCLRRSNPMSMSRRSSLDMDFLFGLYWLGQVGKPVLMDECQIYPAGSGAVKFA